MPEAFQDLLLDFSLCLETFCDGAYLSRIKLTFTKKSFNRKIYACLFLFTNTVPFFCDIGKDNIFLVKVSPLTFINIGLTT